MDLWTVGYKGFQGAREGSLPTLLATGNGRVGIRGAVAELVPSEKDRGIFLAGFYDRLPRPELDSSKFSPFLVSWSHMHLVEGYKCEVCLVKCPDFLDGEWVINGKPLDLSSCEIKSLTRELNTYNGLFTAEINFVTPEGFEFWLTQKRFADMSSDTEIYQQYTIRTVSFTGELEYKAFINANTKNFNISGIYQDTSDGNDHEYIRLYDVVKACNNSPNLVSMLIRGRCEGHRAAFAMRVGAPCATAQHSFTEGDNCGVSTKFHIAEGGSIQLERSVSYAVSTMEHTSLNGVAERVSQLKDFSSAFADSSAVWRRLWRDSDLVAAHDERAQLGIRHGLYHLLIAACSSSDKVSVPAKGLSGEGYRGMVFWDTDIHMMPFYVHTQPAIAKNIAGFRYNTLDGAREKAKRYGQRGASFPWETSVSGSEECEDFLKLLTHQLHITSDVVFAANNYWSHSGDADFFIGKAAELFIETARFWLSKGYVEDGLLNIPDASGPDELHLECDNNAYINNMARHNISLANLAIDQLRKEHYTYWTELKQKLGLEDGEIEQIRNCAVKTMKGEGGLYEQFEGFFKLRDEIVTNDDAVPADTQTVKQADVLMLLYLLPHLVTDSELLANWNYYEPRTTHTSSLSYGVHGIIAARLGLRDKAKYYLDKSLGIDIYSENNNSSDGAHLAAYGMSYSCITNGIAGCRMEGGVLTIKPSPIEDKFSYSFNWQYCGRRFSITITENRISVENSPESSGCLRVRAGDGETVSLPAGEKFEAQY